MASSVMTIATPKENAHQSGAQRIRVLMTSTSYPASLADWRGLFIRHLADALSRRDDLQVALWAPPGDAHPDIDRVTSTAEDAWFASLMRAGGIAHLLRTHKIRALAECLTLLRRLHSVFARQVADVYHINWLQNALPLPNNGRPALITVLGTDMQLLRLPMMRTLIRRSLRNRKATICPNAEWMTGELEAAFGDLARVQALPFGIDPRWYALRRDIATDSPTQWLVVSRLTRDKIGPLFEWCAPLFAGGERMLHLFGPMQESIEVPAWVDYHGPATPDDLRENWFPKAHGLITLSRHSEGRPQVMLESMASGLPIIASRAPAHENLLEHATTGWLVDSPAELEAGIEALSRPVENAGIGAAAKARVQKEVGTWDDCAQRYTTIYRELIQASVA
jgi:glycosyltransferase involved in cell wall biosynthesis